MLGVIDEWSISPLALADNDGDLDLADIMLAAQAVSAARVISGPGGWFWINPPLPLTATSGEPDIPLVWGVFSSFFGVAENTDGIEYDILKIPPTTESAITATGPEVLAYNASGWLTPINSSGFPINISIRSSIAVYDSSGGFISESASNVSAIIT